MYTNCFNSSFFWIFPVLFVLYFLISPNTWCSITCLGLWLESYSKVEPLETCLHRQYLGSFELMGRSAGYISLSVLALEHFFFLEVSVFFSLGVPEVMLSWLWLSDAFSPFLVLCCGWDLLLFSFPACVIVSFLDLSWPALPLLPRLSPSLNVPQKSSTWLVCSDSILIFSLPCS